MHRRRYGFRITRLLALLLLGAASRAPAQEAIFANGFSIDAELCGWDAIVSPCLPSSEVVAFADAGATLHVCLPAGDVDGATFCSMTSCGAAPGCSATVHVLPGTAIAGGSGYGEFRIDLELDDLDASAVSGLVGNCTIQTREATGLLDHNGLQVLSCPEPIPDWRMIANAATGDVFVFATYTIIGDFGCLAAGFIQSAWQEFLAGRLTEELDHWLEEITVGRLRCPLSP